jgi:two-component system, OmpR family, sensor kinase
MTLAGPGGHSVSRAPPPDPRRPGAPRSAGHGFRPPGPGRLSLRSRLLIGLIGLTSAFLVVLGAVSAVVLQNRLGGQFNTELRLLAARSPEQLRSAPENVAAVAFSPGTGQATALNQGSLAAGLSSALGQVTVLRFVGDRLHQPFAIALPDGTTLRAVIRRVAADQVAKAGVKVPSGARLFLVVGRPNSDVNSPVRGVILAELITGGALIALLTIAGRWLIGRGLAPLGRMASAAGGITQSGDLSARMPDADSATETGRLAGAINTMLDRIQNAFAARWNSEQKVRTFAADASHELRTPLTTIRGYAELYRQGALGPDELPNAMRRIEEEAGRMSLLVAELLELARLDRTSSLDLTECDLSAVVRDAAADAAAVEPGRPIKVEAPDRLIAVVDEPRIRQVLANLLANVRTHTTPSTPVSVRLTRAAHGTLIEVADAGPGMSQEDAARAFDRFHRGARGAGPHPVGGSAGAGLGLSIVQAIATAHGGQAMLESEPGRGTIVRVWLPHAAQRQP